MRILNESDLRSLLTMSEVIASVEAGFQALARDAVRMPERMRLFIPERKAVMLEMPAYLQSPPSDDEPTAGAESALGSKIVSVFPQNVDRNLAIIQAAYILLDAETGVPISVLDGRFITAIRTAATSAVATKFMAGPAPKRLAVFGAGVQARFHIEAMMCVAQIERVMITSRSIEKARALCDYVRETYSTACDVVTPDEAASNANLICTCTTSTAPLFDGSLLRPATHINAVGALAPTSRELDTEAIRRARVIIDAEMGAGKEAGEILIPLAEGAIEAGHVKGTLGDVVSGKVAGRESNDELTVFRSSGLAIEDLVTASLAFKRAIAGGVGVEVSF
jgi:ornithine cyclodeaminase/alanine dehydrogenase-like protein (mu-crystallin family)